MALTIDADLSGIASTLEAGREAAAKIRQDPDLTPQAKQQRAQAAQAAAREAAVREAAFKVAAADGLAAAAQATYEKAAAQAEGALDYTRLSVAMGEATGAAMGVRDAAQARAVLDAALQGGTLYEVRAMLKVGLPAMAERLRDAGPEQAMQLAGYEERLAARLQDLQPANVKSARAELEKHQAAQAAIRRGVAALAANYAPDGPGSGQRWALSDVLAPKRELVVETTPDGRRVVTATSGGLFG